MTTNFLSFGLHAQILESLSRLGFTQPTPIQVETIPHALSGKDILGSAQTGTGKTAAYGIPLISHLLKNPQASALVVAPTRELAEQVLKVLENFLDKRRGSATRAALLIGGSSIFKQLQQLKQMPRLVVGTPGRINDHLDRQSLNLSTSSLLVLDEADRMLDMGFAPQIEAILKCMPATRQTMCFSATLPHGIAVIAKKYMSDPVHVAIDKVVTLVANLKQEMVQVSEADKYGQLMTQLEKREGLIIVFVKTKSGAERLVRMLRQESCSVETVHGDLTQYQRTRTIRGFRDGAFRILIATDVAARGLDIPGVDHVINYDLSQCPEDHIHRIGRTARAGAKGSALSFVTPSDYPKWRAIMRLINPEEGDDGASGGHHGSGRPSSYRGGYQGRRFSGGQQREGGGYRGGDHQQSGGYRDRGASSDGQQSGGYRDRGASSDGQQREGGYRGGDQQRDGQRFRPMHDRRSPSARR
jgi:ATP-dependent RNA helicase DeaD